jgi:glycerate kinase
VTRKVVVAPDKFKGSLSAEQVAETVTGALRAHPGLEVRTHPVADGGEGTVEVALGAGFEPVEVTVTGPLGEPVRATFAVRGDVAVLESAAAAGLALLPGPPDESTAWRATTYGVGELVLAAVAHGARRVVLGLGGSATTDGGAGAVAALTGEPRALEGVDLVLACDVDNPLLGPEGAAAVYAPQKGAGPGTVAELEARLRRWADEAEARGGTSARDVPGAGAAGGLAFGLLALAGGRIRPGAELLLGLTGFADAVAGADLLVVGEGSLDGQSLRGKGPVALARSVAATGTRVVAVVGRCLLDADQQRDAGLDAVYALGDLEPDPEVCMRDARRLLTVATEALARDGCRPCDATCPPPAGSVDERRPPGRGQLGEHVAEPVDVQPAVTVAAPRAHEREAQRRRDLGVVALDVVEEP